MKLGILMVAASLSMLPLMACGKASGGNPLIGSWTLSAPSTVTDCPNNQRIFTATTASMHTHIEGLDDSDSQWAVSYNTADPAEIYVMGTAGETGYKIIDKDHIEEQAVRHCTYERVK